MITTPETIDSLAKHFADRPGWRFAIGLDDSLVVLCDDMANIDGESIACLGNVAVRLDAAEDAPVVDLCRESLRLRRSRIRSFGDGTGS